MKGRGDEGSEKEKGVRENGAMVGRDSGGGGEAVGLKGRERGERKTQGCGLGAGHSGGLKRRGRSRGGARSGRGGEGGSGAGDGREEQSGGRRRWLLPGGLGAVPGTALAGRGADTRSAELGSPCRRCSRSRDSAGRPAGRARGTR